MVEQVYQPKRMSEAELLAGFRYAIDRFYSPASILKRLSRSPVQIWWTLPLNLAYSGRRGQSYGSPSLLTRAGE